MNMKGKFLKYLCPLNYIRTTIVPVVFEELVSVCKSRLGLNGNLKGYDF